MALLKKIQKYCRQGQGQGGRLNKAALKQWKEGDWLEVFAAKELAKPLGVRDFDPSRKRRIL